MSPTKPRPGTRAHNIRIPDHRWEAAIRKTVEERTTVTAIVNAALARYVGEEQA